MVTTTTSTELRRRREAAGLTRAQLAALAGCSLTSLANAEQGAVPRRSLVVQRAFEAIAKRLQDNDPAVTPGRVEESGGSPRHGQE